MNEVVHVYRIGYPLSVIGISPKFYIGASLARFTLALKPVSNRFTFKPV